MILFIPNTAIQNDGCQHFLPRPDFDFLNELADKGIQFFVMSAEQVKDDPFSDCALDDILGLQIFSLGMHDKASLAKKLIFYVKAIFKISFFLLKKDRFVYLYYPGHIPMIAGLICALLGKKYALYVRGVWKQTGVRSRISNYIFTNAKFIFTTGLGFSRQIQQLNVNTEPVYPMTTFPPNQISIDQHKYSSYKRALFVGHIRERKGILDVIRSIELTKKQGIDLYLDVVGGGDADDIGAISSLAQELNLQDRVSYHGHVGDVDELAKYFNNADVFLYPSYYPEGFPRVVYEAMIFGLPIVCTILPGMKGFIEHGVNSLEVPGQKPELIAEALVKLGNDEALRARLGGTARKMIEDYFSSMKIKGHAGQFYNNLNP